MGYKDKIREFVKANSRDNLKDHEITVKDNGDIIVDRRRDIPWAKPGRIAQWKNDGKNIKITPAS